MENGMGCVPMLNGNEEPCVIMRTANGCKAKKMLVAAGIATMGVSGASAQMGYGSASAVSSSVISACVPTTVTVTPSVSAAADQTTAEVDGVQGSETTISATAYTTKTAFVTLGHSDSTTFVKATQPAADLTSTVTVYNSTTTLMGTGMVGTGTGASWATGTGSFNTAANGTYAHPTATAGPEHAGAASSTVSYTHLALALIASAALGAVLGA
ncbi:hypothetical protein B0T20DRAFT_452686 [Sordaria brevicollis]|uniref:Uncharacterized protein n=1 Tax=Sordaria brevicollis TaxID=83679 RepID=A0AAE0UCJ8_SORBR|nr:hypothetical protein B0T20DRAFT_452686 [Sordaria brevicollis]